ncbi:maltose alpha-D-glucosyltransferase/alpha-amylase [Roseimicrobium gellanilyticum]|uniref:Maltokinase n=1 Tax=Roseimicrobium gellanilyticum TaxID=748857 RepID=A0A366H6F2_9BACT|nr:maltose alpha-D-glucosyltransferase [Roseimicrobium gellanilyticum]RBP37698.1 maltose alpha-D-glucosyltransferase/alpha-amylase [Roseimicrobium gellanilyticum]
MNDPLWFKDAVIYELHVKTFQDSDGDGLGDFRGLITRLDYLADLGVTAIWLLPFYPSPLRDDGYDISDYFAINPTYGTLEDFHQLLEEAHKRDLKIITELVLNHTSDQNVWFQRARKAPAGSPERDFYVWSDDPRKYKEARIIFKDFETSNWTWDSVAKQYFWHRFYSHQPDLNFDNPAVHDALFKVIDFWLEMGVDGVRLDAVPYLYEREGTNCENLDETHAFLRKLRQHVDGKFPGRMLLAEANQWPEDAVAYFGKGDECHMEFHFPLMPRMFMSLQMEDRFPIIDIMDQTPAIPDNCQWAIFLRNHDELTLEMVTDEERDYMYRVYAKDPRARINLGIRRRLAPLLGNNRRKIELINSLLLSLPGTPVIYYGDEIGMGDNFYLGDRNGVRTPMQWNADRNAGFSKANPQQLFLPVIIDPEYHYESVNVENQQGNLSSLFWWMRRVLGVRRQSRAFSHGNLEFLHPDNAKILAFTRRHEDEIVLIVANLSRFTQYVEINLASYAGLVPEEMFGHTRFPEIRQTPTPFTIGPHGCLWFTLKPSMASIAGEASWIAPEFEEDPEWGPSLRKEIERELLPGFLPLCRWFGGKGRVVREMKVVHLVPTDVPEVRLVVVEVSYTEGLPERYLMPLSITGGEEARQMLDNLPAAVLAKFKSGEVLADAFHLASYRLSLLNAITKGTRGKPKEDVCIVGSSAGSVASMLDEATTHTRVVSIEQSNTSIVYGEKLFLKFFRKYEAGIHPDLEMTQKLQEAGFEQVPAYLGSLKLQENGSSGAVAMLGNYIQNQGDGWAFALDAVMRYFDRVLEARATSSQATTDDLIGGVFPGRAGQLGTMTARMHLALLALGESSEDFAPEPFSMLYQRSLYQAMRGAAGRVLRKMQMCGNELPEHVREDVQFILASKDTLLNALSQFLEHKISALKTRTHGDFHLGQVLNTGKEFVVIDFEGEPSLSMGERRLKRSPLRDVAGMLRSFDYAASTALKQEREDDARYLASHARTWVKHVSNEFLRCYFKTAEGAAFLPPEEKDTRLMLRMYMIEKAVYEIGYEISYRPSFVDVPIGAVRRMLEEETGNDTD